MLPGLLGCGPAGIRSPHPPHPPPPPLCSPVFNGSVLCPYAILNEQQGVACQDPLPAARHSGTARKQLGPPQGFHRQRTKDDQPDPPGRSEGGWVASASGGLSEGWPNADVRSALQDLGVFIPAPMSQGMRMDFFLESPFIPNRVKLDRETLGGLADMFGQMPGPPARRRCFCLVWVSASKANVWFCSPGSGIGTGPGVIQDRYSPTMGRHRTNPLFNGHGGHIAPPPQSQFDMGPKSFVKSNQVGVTSPEAWMELGGPPRPAFTSVCATGAEPAFPQPEPEPLGPAAGPVQGHASAFQQERPDQRRRGSAALG